jgi:hypothetical protein
MRRTFLAAFVVFTAAAQTQIDLRTQAKSVDFTAATATKPVKTGTTLPGLCTVGEMFFKTDAPAGANLYGCTEADQWSVQGGIPSQDCWYDSADSTLKCRDAGGNVYAAVKTSSGPTFNQWVDYISLAGVPHTSQPTAAAVGALADSGANGVPYRSGPGTAAPANADNLSATFSCQDVGAVNAYACNLAPPIGAYTAGTTYWFKANTANTGSVTINFNGLGAKQAVKQANQQLDPGDIKAGQWVMVTYDGLAMQMQSQIANPASGSVASVFGRTGLVAAQAGDYTTAQVTESGNLYFTNPRAQAAFSFPGVVRFSAGALDCPSCVTTSTQADTDLYGTFPHLSVVKLQGRLVSTTQPADQQYLGWNNGASQWEPKTLPAPPVSSIFGRSGAVAAQNGDYAFSQISGTLAAPQLPATVMRTDSNNTATAGTQDMRGAEHTLPMKSGATADLPSTCQVGETYFATDTPAGNNVYGCTAANTWSGQGTNFTVASDGTVVGFRPKANFTTGPGLLSLMADTGSEIDILWALDTAVVQTQPGEQTGRALLCASASGSPTNYQCSLTPTLAAYVAGMTLHWKPDVNGSGGPTTLNIDTLGALPIKLRDGASNPASTDIVAGQLYDAWYDGAQFRLMTPMPSTDSGSVFSIFGRQGSVVSQAGDYTTDQITEATAKFFTNARAQAAMSGLYQTPIAGAPGSWPSTFAPSAHAATHAAAGSDPLTLSPSQAGLSNVTNDAQLKSSQLVTTVGSPGLDTNVPSEKAVRSAIPSVPSPSSANPAMDGTAAPGSSANYTRADHVHPTDTSRQAAITGAPASWPSFAAVATSGSYSDLSNKPTALPPNGSASGDLGGSYPGPTVRQIHDSVTAIAYSNSPYSVAATDSYISCNATSGAVVINLPATTGSGREITVKKLDSSANACTPTRAGSDTIDGAATISITAQYAAVKLLDAASGSWVRTHVNQLAGDVTGSSQANAVAKLQGRAVSSSAPADTNVLAWSTSNSQWQPTAAAASGAAIAYALILDGSTTTLADGSTVTWSCGSGSGAQCTTNWTVPAGVNWVRVRAWGGGGGGGGGNASYSGYGGGGGGYWESTCAVTPAGSVAVAVGLGGAGMAGTSGGNLGGDTTFGTCFTVMGGLGGYATRSGWNGHGWGGRILGSSQAGWNSPTGNSTAMTGSASDGYGSHAYNRPDGGGCGGLRAGATAGNGGAGGDALNGSGGGGGGGLSTGAAQTGGAGGLSFGGGAGGAGGGFDGANPIACGAGSIPGGGGGASSGYVGSGSTTGCAGARGEVRVYYAK